MTDHRTPPIAPDHATHDRLLVAALADRGIDALTPSERAQAEAQLAACRECAALHADLVLVAAALPTAAIPTRPRDFTLSPADAERLRPRGVRRLIGLIGSSKDAFTRPLALGLTTLGIVGLLVASLPGVLSGFGSGGAATALSTVGSAVEKSTSEAQAPASAAASAGPAEAASGAPVAAASGGGVPAAPAPSRIAAQADGSLGPVAAGAAAPSASGGDDSRAVYGADNGAPETNSGGQNAYGGTEGTGGLLSLRDEADGGSPLVVIAGTLLIVGLGLFALRWSARRLREG
jgi:hypothetical protein